jgi:hypothetical protein
VHAELKPKRLLTATMQTPTAGDAAAMLSRAVAAIHEGWPAAPGDRCLSHTTPASHMLPFAAANVRLHVHEYGPRTAFCAAMLEGPPRLGIQKKPLVSRPSSAALVSALRTTHITSGKMVLYNKETPTQN